MGVPNRRTSDDTPPYVCVLVLYSTLLHPPFEEGALLKKPTRKQPGACTECFAHESRPTGVPRCVPVSPGLAPNGVPSVPRASNGRTWNVYLSAGLILIRTPPVQPPVKILNSFQLCLKAASFASRDSLPVRFVAHCTAVTLHSNIPFVSSRSHTGCELHLHGSLSSPSSCKFCSQGPRIRI